MCWMSSHLSWLKQTSISSALPQASSDHSLMASMPSSRSTAHTSRSWCWSCCSCCATAARQHMHEQLRTMKFRPPQSSCKLIEGLPGLNHCNYAAQVIRNEEGMPATAVPDHSFRWADKSIDYLPVVTPCTDVDGACCQQQHLGASSQPVGFQNASVRHTYLCLGFPAENAAVQFAKVQAVCSCMVTAASQPLQSSHASCATL